MPKTNKRFLFSYQNPSVKLAVGRETLRLYEKCVATFLKKIHSQIEAQCFGATEEEAGVTPAEGRGIKESVYDFDAEN